MFIFSKVKRANVSLSVRLALLPLAALVGLIVAVPQHAHALNLPSWWNGTACDTAHYTGAYSLGTSYNGVTACGPRPIKDGGTDLMVHFFTGAWGENEWECAELSMRYMYLAYGVNPYNANGKDVVPNYSGSALSKVNNDGTSLPTPGDIISESATINNAFGHTGIVTSVNVTNGTGTVTMMEQNASAGGSSTISVASNVLGSNVSGWLHSGTPPPPPSNYLTFQANNSQLFSYTTSGLNTNQGMLGHTSPATAALSDGSYETAFVANNGALFVLNSNNPTSSTPTYQGVAANTSPSITGFSGGGWQAVFQGADGSLHGWDSSGSTTNFGQPMAAGTSPAIAALTSGGWRVAYQSNTNSLNLYSVGTGGSSNTNLGQGMAAGTSPSITGLNGSTWIAAFQANNGSAFVFNSAVGYGQSLGLGMAGGTSPVIISLTTSVYDVLAQANNGLLYLRTSTNGYNTNLNQGMLGSTSPSVARIDNSNYVAAFQANNYALFTYQSGSGSTNTGQGMAAYSSPAVALPVGVN